ncbi:MAG: rhodanese-related sulfurtransferase [Nanoarchaeota archaeon]|nr:rhodanese-related sulfurtransferase [Nanoarchaeota archaeon]
MTFKVISFYKYIPVDNPQSLRQELQQDCQKRNLLGRILIGNEGINGAVSGETKNIELFMQKLTANALFSDLTFREQLCAKNTYHKLVVRVRKEIVAFGSDVEITNKGTALSPMELKQWYDQKEDFVIIDARNDYEYAVGKFKDAIGLPIKNFRQFPEMLPKLKPFQEKKIILYCTGGIRCEKASAFLKGEGFENVYQLDGGIINYVNQFPETYWEGNCFVFDDRLVSKDGKPITSCAVCSQECGEYLNCYNLDCDALFVCCQSCRVTMKNTCSVECSAAPRQRKVQDNRNYHKIGIVQNYYSKAGVAEVKVNGMLSTKTVVSFKGKTTSLFTQEITELRDDTGNEIECSTGIVTFPVLQKVRKNDLVVIES